MRIFILFSFLFWMANGQAQVELSVDPPSFSDTFLLDLSVDYSEQTAIGTLKNETGEEVALRWLLHKEDAGCPDSWWLLFCDNNFCGSSTTISNINPGSDPNIPLEIGPGQTSTFDLTIRPRGSEGCCSPFVTVTTIDNFDEVLWTAQYHICVEGITAVDEVEEESIRLFPNPTSGQFYLSEKEKVHEVRVSDWSGKMLRSFSKNEDYDLSHFSEGFYLVQVLGRNGVLLETVKVGKL